MLSQNGILANLTISQWTGRKLDRKATGQVETSFSTQKQVGNFTKKLLPGAKELNLVKAISGETRKFFYENTLPWMSDGSRILSAKNYLDFTKEIRERKHAFDRAVTEFLSHYNDLRLQAKIKLGDLFNEKEYPSIESLRQSFKFDISFLPIPDVKDFRTEVLEGEKATFIQKMKEVENEAIKECYSRLKEVVERAAEKLNSPDAVFRDSLIQNVADICALLPRLNINEDSKLESTRLEVEKIVASISPDVCRDNATERDKAAKKLNDINDKMGAIMGALKVG